MWGRAGAGEPSPAAPRDGGSAAACAAGLRAETGGACGPFGRHARELATPAPSSATIRALKAKSMVSPARGADVGPCATGGGAGAAQGVVSTRASPRTNPDAAGPDSHAAIAQPWFSTQQSS